MASGARKQGIVALSTLLGLGGFAAIVYALTRSLPGAPGSAPLNPGEGMTNLHAANLEAPTPGGLQIAITGAVEIPYISAVRPRVTYVGPGRDTFTYFAIRQVQRGALVTVYASGVAGVHVGPASVPMVFDLVSPSQPQPEGCPAQSLCANAWPGFPENPVCGAPPIPGPASVYLEIYERRYPVDADGFSNPSCNDRRWVAQKVYPNKVTFL